MKFSIGDRVQVSEYWFVEELRGATGTIIEPHHGCRDLRHEGVYWIAFDSSDLGRERGGNSFTDSAEVDGPALRRI